MIFGHKHRIKNLDDVVASSFKMLRRGVDTVRHPFHWPVLATLNGTIPEVRTVILRGFSQKDRTLHCYCDSRTPKVHQIRRHPAVGWLFYHPRRQVQLRINGMASVHTDDNTADFFWKKVGMASRINYGAGASPGSPASGPASGLPYSIRKMIHAGRDDGAARQHFAVIVCRFHRLDWLQLKIAGNVRATFNWENGMLQGTWVIP